jgi:hypothetical protein
MVEAWKGGLPSILPVPKGQVCLRGRVHCLLCLCGLSLSFSIFLLMSFTTLQPPKGIELVGVVIKILVMMQGIKMISDSTASGSGEAVRERERL